MNNDVYISGESYAGIYVPKLASRLNDYLVKNKDDPTKYKPKFKGFMVGNGVTNWKYDTQPALIEMAYWHGLYDD
jgi:carboxypeptidase C (cathepsin A)